MDLTDTVARNLRRLREERQLTQEELAHLAGLTRNYVGMIERRENSPTVAVLGRLASVLAIDPRELLAP